jgi:hypothetical protein
VAPLLVSSAAATATVNVSACRLRKKAAMGVWARDAPGVGTSQGRHPNKGFG